MDPRLRQIQLAGDETLLLETAGTLLIINGSPEPSGERRREFTKYRTGTVARHPPLTSKRTRPTGMRSQANHLRMRQLAENGTPMTEVPSGADEKTTIAINADRIDLSRPPGHNV